jgi:hypothetical protein
MATWGVISASILKRADRADSSALQIFSQRFQLNGLVLVGDRGMTTAARRPTSGLDHRAARIRHPGPRRDDGPLQPCLFYTRDGRNTPALRWLPTRDKVPRPRIEASAPPRVPNATLVCRPLP